MVYFKPQSLGSQNDPIWTVANIVSSPGCFNHQWGDETRGALGPQKVCLQKPELPVVEDKQV